MGAAGVHVEPAPRGLVEPGRRAVLRGLARGLVVAGLTLGASGCGVRLEDDAPRIPLVPTRQPVPAESALLTLLAETRALARLAAEGSGSLAPRLAAIHDEQVTFLAAALTNQQVPARLQAAATAPAATALRAAEAAALADDRLTGLAACGPALHAPVISLLAQRYAAVRLLGGKSPLPTATRAWPDGRLAARLAEATRAAAYGFEVAAAQSSGRQRARAVATLGDLRALAAEQMTASGEAAPAPALGYRLPFEVTSASDARRLATQAVTGLLGAYGKEVEALHALATRASVTPDVVAWLGRSQVLAAAWEVEPAAFPGLH